MNSRERVMAAVNHKEPDRVPVDLGGHRSSGIMAIAYNKLKRHLGVETGDIYVYDVVQQLAIIEPDVLAKFDVDTIEMGRGFAFGPDDWHDWQLPDGTPCKIPAFIRPEKVAGDWHVYHEDGTLIGIQDVPDKIIPAAQPISYVAGPGDARAGVKGDGIIFIMLFQGLIICVSQEFWILICHRVHSPSSF